MSRKPIIALIAPTSATSASARAVPSRGHAPSAQRFHGGIGGMAKLPLANGLNGGRAISHHARLASITRLDIMTGHVGVISARIRVIGSSRHERAKSILRQ